MLLCDRGGQHAATQQGDRIGMLLDLDQGSMAVWKNDEKLGVMQAEELSGPLCWAVSMINISSRIESAAAPPSPTQEDLMVAKGFASRRRRNRLKLPPMATGAECEAAEAIFALRL